MRFLTEILAKAGITSNYFQVDTAAATPAGAPGKIVWNDTDGTLEFQMKGGNVTQQIGQELPVLVKHADNTGLTNGKVVYQAGSDGSNVLVRYAAATAESTSSKTFGVMTESVTGGGKAFCTTFGYVRNIDTSLLTEGSMIWLSETAGEMTTTRPTQPAHGVVVGRCIRQHASVGVIFVAIQNGFELDEIHDVLITSKANNEILTYESATNLWKNKTISVLLGYTPANDSSVVHIAGAETITGVKTFSSVINASTLSINGGTLVGNNIVSMRSNPTGGQFRIEKSDGSLSAYPFYIGVDGTALAYYYNAAGALKVLLHTDNTSYFGNSLSVGYASYAATSYMLDVNGTARFTGALTGTSATFSGAINLTGTANSFQVASIFRNTNRVFFGGDTGGYFFQNSGNTSTILQIADSGYATFSYFLQATGKLFLQRASNGADTLIQFKNEAGVDRAYIKFGGTNEELSFYPGAGAAEAMQIKSTRQLQLNAYTSATSFSGTAAGYLAFDSSGNVITVAGVAATDNTKLPLTGGSLTGPLTITGNGSYLGDWGYKTLELNDTSGYAGIFFKNGANIWITRRNGADNAMDWAYSTNATAQGTGTFTQKMRLASDEWWVSTYPNYKMRVVGGDVLESLNGTSATTLYLQYHSNTGGNVNIAASKFIFYNTGEFSLGGGSGSSQSTLASGLTAIRFPNQYSSGYTDAGVKLYIFNSGTTIQGFTAGPAYDLQYHSSGSDSGRNALYVANAEVIRFNKTLVLSSQNFAVGSQQGFDNPGGWNKNILIDGTNHGRFRIKASNHTYGNIDVALWADSSVSPSHGINGSNAVFAFNGSITSLTVGGQTVIHTGNIGSQSVSLSSQVTINYNNDSNSTYQLLWGSGNSVYGTSQVYINPYSDVIYARGGYISPGNPWGTSDSAFFPNGITTAGGTNWIYGTTYLGNAPGNGAGHQFWADGTALSTSTYDIGKDSSSNTGVGIKYTSGGYGRIRFYQDGSNHSTIHSFGSAGYSPSSGKINLDGQTGVNIGPWNDPDFIVNKGAQTYARGYRGIGNVGGTGEASYHPAGIYSTGTNWLYGTMYMNNNSIRDVMEVYNNGWFRTVGNQGLYNPTNGAHFYPNDLSYGSWRILGSKNGWTGLHFGGGNGITLMMNEGEFGFHREGVGWVARFTSGRFYGTADYAVSAGSATDSSKLPLSGGTINGNLTVYGNYATSGEIYTGYQFKCGSGSDTPYLNNPYGADHFRAAGTAWFTYTAIGSTNFFSTSRRAVKTMITNFDRSATDLINSVNVVEFRYKNDLNNKRIGFIAEDTIEELATKQHDQMDLNSSIGLLLKAVQELSADNNLLKQEISLLKQV